MMMMMMMIAREGLIVFTRNSTFLDKGVFKRIDSNERPAVLNMGLDCTCIFVVVHTPLNCPALYQHLLEVKARRTSKTAE